MSDERVRITNFPDSGSAERVAYDLMQYIISYADEFGETRTRDKILDLYAACLDATHDRRHVKS